MATQQPAGKTGSADRATEQVLTFELGKETYGVDILRVREIRGWAPVTKIPQAPSYVLGVLNLRGSIVPVMDLRMRLDLQRAEYTSVTVIIVLSVRSQSGRDREVGVVVDAVSDVLSFNTAAMKAPPELGPNCPTDYIRGLTNSGKRMVILLDIDRLIGTQLSGMSDQADPALAGV